MRKIISNAIMASVVVALITSLFSFLIRGTLNWIDVLNSVIATFIIWAVLFPIVHKHWRGQMEE